MVMRQLRVAGWLVLGVVALGVISAAQAQEISVQGRTFASLEAFLEGNWIFYRREPAQTMRLRFGGSDRSLYFNNETAELIHYGSYKSAANGVELTITKSCDPKGCTDRNPPAVLTYPIKPDTPNRFYSNDEEWNRAP